ncbi:amino acid ABC transporter substrate-binding protein (PAAT family) [Tamilnaduibacter salinus]|nr:transporter substrate-binding domain-containing protein [Tamilnaduibacter salinus]PVY79004.1 amino acid ABC transporter substrate-binding protein (PAAT family) [Tamilnaduibacter salinus]
MTIASDHHSGLQQHRSRRGALLAAIILSFLASPAIASDSDRTVNYLVIDSKAAPFQIVQGGKSHGGIVSDLVDAIFEPSSYGVKHRVLPVNRLKQMARERQVRHWVTYDATQWATFEDVGTMIHEPLFSTHHVLLTCAPTIPDRISDVEALDGRRLVTLRHFEYPPIEAASQKGRLKQVAIDRYEAGIRLVELQRVDGFVEMKSRLQYHMTFRDRPPADCLRWIDLDEVIPDFDIYLAVDADWPPDFRDYVAQRIRELRDQGRIRDIRSSYLTE